MDEFQLQTVSVGTGKQRLSFSASVGVHELRTSRHFVENKISTDILISDSFLSFAKTPQIIFLTAG
jgi:hypothetical protein